MASMNPHPYADALARKKAIEREMQKVSIAMDDNASTEIIEHKRA